MHKNIIGMLKDINLSK